MGKARWIWATGATVMILAALGAGLWLGGGPATRDGWESASWVAGITATLWLIVTAINRANTSTTSTPPPTSTPSKNNLIATNAKNKDTGEVMKPQDEKNYPTKESPKNQIEEIDHIQSLISAHRDNIRILEQQVALFGPLHAPTHKKIELEMEKKKLKDLKDRLEGDEDA
ncbi:hypothetical protein ACWFMI_25495 [Nocardiopsis terrae]